MKLLIFNVIVFYVSYVQSLPIPQSLGTSTYLAKAAAKSPAGANSQSSPSIGVPFTESSAHSSTKKISDKPYSEKFPVIKNQPKVL